jgi:hypothetical protein
MGLTDCLVLTGEENKCSAYSICIGSPLGRKHIGTETKKVR